MAPRTPRVTCDEVIAALRKLGFRKVSQKGSHQKWKHPITQRRTVVAYHRGRIIHPKTLETIVEGTGLTMDEFRKWL